MKKWLAAGLLLILSACGGGGGGGSSESPSYNISLAVINVTSSNVQLSVTANFNGSVPLWRNGYHYADLSLQSGQALIYTDYNVVSNTEFCYQVGGHGVLFGNDVWSNVVCVTPP